MSIGDSLLKSLGNAGLSDLVESYGEITLDLLSDNKIVDDIPVLGTIRRGANIILTIQDKIFAKSYYDFFMH